MDYLKNIVVSVCCVLGILSVGEGLVGYEDKWYWVVLAVLIITFLLAYFVISCMDIFIKTSYFEIVELVILFPIILILAIRLAISSENKIIDISWG